MLDGISLLHFTFMNEKYADMDDIDKRSIHVLSS
jgi:hypothetical protein